MQRRLFDGVPRSDLHVHTSCSPDSSASPDDVCRAAISANLDALGITDHAESWEPRNPASPVRFNGRACDSTEGYFRILAEMKAQYAGRLEVITGVEIGYFSLREDDIRKFLSGAPFQYAIGSVHESPPVNWWDATSQSVLRDRPDLARQALKTYYTEIRKAAESGLFAIIGHIDVYERYFPAEWPNILEDDELVPVVRSAVQAVAEHSRMEINLTTLHTLKDFPWSALDLLKMYREMGGRPPALGSDSHLPKYVGQDLEKGKRLAMMAGFEETADWREIVRESRSFADEK